MIAWIDEPTWVLVEVNTTGVYLSDRHVGRWPFCEATPAMAEAWGRFCAHHAPTRPALELMAGPS
jgi:threonine dehydrogenase-like Zn-dependent dehydrogenase